MSIQRLSQDIAGKIAAGEVVERPANVAKELIENSLDAGATEVQVEIREGGRRLLRVMDNGGGIPAAELPLAVQRHATSKLRTAEDLNRIATFGFRGEALYSIAAVSRLTVSSRHAQANAGAELRLEGGAVVQQRPAGLPVGTVVAVEHIFFNTPARRKFLRRPATEAGHIGAIVQRYALAYPGCRFSFINDGKLAFHTTGSGRVVDVLIKIYGRENAQQMIGVGRSRGQAIGGAEAGRGAEEPADEVDFMPDSPPPQSPIPSPQQPIAVSGFVSLPSLTRANRSQIDLFVNRRYVEDRSLTHAVVQAYHTLLPVGRYPLAVVFVEMDPADVDVNVHPRKTEVRFADARQVYAAVQRTVRRAVIDSAGVPEVSIHPEGPAPQPDENAAPPDWFEQSSWAARRASILQAGAAPQPGLPFSPPTAPGQTGPAAPQTAAVPAPEPDAAPEPPAGSLPPLRVVGQAGAMYVVAEGPEGLYLIDQHAAHERILYEKFMAQRYGSGGEGTADGIARQGLLEPIPLHVGDARAGLVAQHLPALHAAGFEVEPFGGDTFLIRAIPGALSNQDAERVLEEVVQGLAEERNLVGEELEARLVKMVCKRASIKAGQILSDIEMKELIRQLEQCDSPRTCPHGRPTMLQLSAGELERAFKRT